uniref:Single minded 2 n=1 Tax=Echinococcus granulosus TaxID=6210 RepID=A0A068WES1_ECHGR|nr:single minded 2 [Echinococcus granulosus]
MLEALDGFPLIISGSGSVIYIGETVKTLLGLAKWDVTGAPFVAIVKEEDQEELEEVLELHPSELSQIDRLNTEFRFERRFTVRVKCVLSKRNSGLSSEGYKVLHYGGYITAGMFDVRGGPRKVVQWLCGIASTLPSVNGNSTDVKMSRDMFMFRASLGLEITYADEQLQVLTGYQARDIIDKSLYQLIHLGDANELEECHITLLTKGQVTTRYFRLLCKHGGWVWAQTHATILRNARGSKSDCVVGVTYVLAEIQAARRKFDVKQLQVDSIETSNCGRTLASKPTNSSRRKRSYPSQNALQIEALQPLYNCESSVPISNVDFYQNLNGGTEGGGGDVWYVSSNPSTSYQPPPQPNHAGLISDAYANQSGIVVQQPTGMSVSPLNLGIVEEAPYFGGPFSDSSIPSSSVPSSSIPSSFIPMVTNSYLEQLGSYQVDANFPEYWQDPSYYYQS